MHLRIYSSQLVAKKGPDAQFNGCKGGENRCSQPDIEVVERQDIPECGASLEGVPAARAIEFELPERVPVTAQPVIADASQYFDGPTGIFHHHAARLEKLNLLLVRPEQLAGKEPFTGGTG